MGLFIITGTMGGGKSYFAAELARDCWRAGGIVHSNIPWNADELDRHDFGRLHVKLPDDVSTWVRKEPSPEGGERLASDWIIGGTEGAENLIIVDEAALAFHMYDQLANRARNRTIFELVVMSRQIGVDMYFISQSAQNIDVAIRNVAEAVIHCVNVKRLPGIGPLLGLFVGDFRRNWLSPLKRQVMSHSYARFNPSVAALYNTHGVGDKINVQRSEGRARKGVQLSVGAWLFIVALLGLGGGSFHLYRKSGGFLNFSNTTANAAASGEHAQIQDLRKAAASRSSGPVVVAVLSEPLTYYISSGDVYSFVPRYGVRRIVAVSESAESVTLDAEGESVTFAKPKPPAQ